MVDRHQSSASCSCQPGLGLVRGKAHRPSATERPSWSSTMATKAVVEESTPMASSVNASQAMPLKLAVFLSAPFFMLLAVVAMFCPPVTSLPNSTANTSFAISGHEGK
jgi:hypothetical protein